MVARVALIIGVLATPGTAWAAPFSEGDLVARLSDHESVPDASELVVGGEAVAMTLFQIFRNDALPTFVRVRALRVIASFAVDVATPLLQQALRIAGSRAVFVREAVAGLVHCRGAQATADLAPLLQRPEATVRRAAIDGLGQLATPEARVTLQAHRAHEADPSVRAALDMALAPGPGH